MKKYDYLIVGSGLYGAVFAHEALKKNNTGSLTDEEKKIAETLNKKIDFNNSNNLKSFKDLTILSTPSSSNIRIT